jgi:hypothetical protein
VAKQDILNEFEEKEYKEHIEAENEYYTKLDEERVEHVVDHYLNHLGSAYAVKKKTSEEKRNEIYNVIELANKTRMYHKAYSNPKVGCVTILCVMLDFWRDLDASIFLSVHGKYGPANALLRRWLEIFITALYFDAELKRWDEGSKKYKDTIEKRDRWFKGTQHHRLQFTGDGGIVHTLIDQHTENIATQLLKEKTYLFSWNKVPGNDSERLLRYLKENRNTIWAENAKICKTDGDKNIRVCKDENSAKITIDEKEEKATLEIGGKMLHHHLKVKKENYGLNIHETFKTYVDDIFRKLSDYVHYGGGTPLDELTRDSAEYDEKLFEEWYGRLNQINEICNILTLLKFPEITGSDSEVVDVVNAIVKRCEREGKKLNDVVDELIRKGLDTPRRSRGSFQCGTLNSA